MNGWQLQTGGSTTTLTEDELRTLLSTGAVSETALVRPPGAPGFVPVHHLALARAAPPARRPDWRALAVHAVIFIGAVGFLMRGPLLALATLWTVGLVAHAVWVALGLRAARPALAEPAAATAPASAFLQEVDEAAQAVHAAWQAAPRVLGDPPDLEGLRSAAARLDSAHGALAALFSEPELLALREERAAAETRRSGAQDPASAEIFAEELAALEDRLAAMEAARVVSEQLAARKRTLLHQLAGLRLAAVQTAASSDEQAQAPEAERLVQKTASLRDALRASAEVEGALARARAHAREERR